MDSRAAFEAECNHSGHVMSSWHDGGYMDDRTHLAWTAWQAATERAAKKVESVNAPGEKVGTLFQYLAAAIRA